MWPFSTKEPLSPQKLPIAEAWMQRQGHDPMGKPMLIRTNTGYSKFKGVTGFYEKVIKVKADVAAVLD